MVVGSGCGRAHRLRLGGGSGHVGQSRSELEPPPRGARGEGRGPWSVCRAWRSAHQLPLGDLGPGARAWRWGHFCGCPWLLRMRVPLEKPTLHTVVLGVPSRWCDLMAESAGDPCGRGRAPDCGLSRFVS